MRLTPGEKIGPYEIVAAIGAGGMGEEWKACDLRLDPTVITEVLPDHIVKRDDLPQRFDREAQAFASLRCATIPFQA